MKLFRRVCAPIVALAAIATTAVGGEYSDLVNSHGPVAYWRFGEAAGSTAADETGSYNASYDNGVTLGGAGALVGDADTSATFTSSADEVDVGTGFDVTGSALTIVAWIKPSNTSGSDRRIFCQATSHSTSSNYLTLHQRSNQRIGFRLKTSGGTSELNTPTGVLQADAWHLVAATYDGSQMLISIDGVQIARLNKSGALDLSGTSPTTIGDAPQGNREFVGSIDELAVLPRALSQAELISLYVTARAPSKTLLLVTAGATPTSQEQLRIDQFESWGYHVFTISAAEPQSAYDAVAPLMDVAYVSEEIFSSNLGTKLRNAAIGVFFEEPYNTDDFGVSSHNSGSAGTHTSLTISEGAHYVTSPFGSGSVLVFSSAQSVNGISGSLAGGADVLGGFGASVSLVAIDTGGDLANTRDGSNTAYGRRVYFGFGDNFNFASLTPDGLTIIQRSLEWAAAEPAATFYVRPDGSDSNPGTGSDASDAWATLAHAVTQSQVVSGATIHVMPGTYTGQVAPSVDGASGDPIRVVADTDGSEFGATGEVVVTHSGYALHLDGDDYWTFEGVTFTTSGYDATAVYADDATGLVLDRCRIRDAGRDGLELTAETDAEIINCLIHDVGQAGVASRHTDVTVEILNCTIADCGTDGIYQSAGAVTARNTILAHVGDDSWDSDGGTPVLVKCILWANGGDNSEGFNGSSEIRRDPKLVDRSADDYRLGPGSNAINEGSDLAAVTTDIDGAARPAGAYDVGAYEAAGFFYVRTDGSNSNDGTGSDASEAWATLAHAVTQSDVTPGSMIFVMPGAYSGQIEPAVSGASGAPIVVVGDVDGEVFDTRGEVLITHTTSVLYLDEIDYWEFECLALTNSGASNLIVRVEDSEGFALSRCRVFDTASNGLRFDDDTSATLTNCLIYDIGGHGILVSDEDVTLTVLNCTIADCASDGIHQDDGDVTARNTILAHIGDDCWDQDGGTLAFSNNIEFDYGGSGSEGFNSSSNIRDDPAFADRDADNYHLGGGSAAAGAGQDLAEVTDDLRGMPRYTGSYDIGAYANSMVGWWKLDEASGATAADASGYGNDGALYNSPTLQSDGIRGSSYNLSGSAHVRVPDNETLQTTDEVTVAAWIRCEDAAASQTVLQKGQNYSLWQYRGGYPYTEIHIGGWQTFDYSVAGTEFLNRWRHVAFTYDGSQLINYVDGQVDSTYAQTGQITTNDKWLGIGTNGDWDDHRFQGSIDDVRVYNRALSQTEIAEIFGLVGHWKLDESGGLTAADSSLLGRDADYSGGVTLDEDGVRNRAVAFDGLTGAVSSSEAADALDAAESVSLAAWVRPDTLGNSVRVVGNGRSEGFRLELTSGNQPKFHIHAAGGKHSVTANETIEAERWTQLVGVYDGSKLRVYIDGQLVRESSVSAGALVTNEHALIIGSSSSGDNSFDGAIDDVVAYDRVMTDVEIAEHYGLIAHWKLDETSGTTAVDSSGLGNDANYVNFPTQGIAAASLAPTGTAVEFDGVSQYVDSGKSILDDFAGFTIAGWVKPADIAPDRSFFGQNDLVELGIDYDSHQIDLWTANGGWLSASFSLPLSSWTHLVATGDGSSLRLYANGALVATGGSATATYGSNSDVFRIGEGVLDPTGDTFQGAMDDVRVYNRAITPEQARELYYGNYTPGLRIVRWVETANP